MSAHARIPSGAGRGGLVDAAGCLVRFAHDSWGVALSGPLGRPLARNLRRA